MFGGGLSFRSVSRTHTGLVRAYNEDACLARDDIGLFAVADGMGGHTAGDVASEAIVGALGAAPPPEDGRAFIADIRQRLQGVNLDLFQQSSAGPEPKTMGSTIVVMLIYDDFDASLWAGDSRLYRLRQEKLDLLTHDHSYVQELVDSGKLDPEGAYSHPMRNVITRAVGAAASFELDVCHGPINPGDVFLLCSDGLSNVVQDEELAGIIANEQLPTAADKLIALSLERGAPDNVSLVIVRTEVT